MLHHTATENGFTTAPELATDRLVLRAHGIADFPALSALWGDPVVARFTTGNPSTPEQVWSRLLRYAGHWQLLGFGYWAVIERASGQLIGDVGLADYRRMLEPTLDGTAELGWVLAPAFHGKGYAEEATRAILAWAALCLPGKPITCIIDPDNQPSIRLAGKLGFVETARSQYGEAVMLQYRLMDRASQS